MDTKKLDIIENYYKEIIKIIGEDPNREGLIKTPKRVSKSIKFLTSGYEQDPIEIIHSAIFEEDHKQIVIVKDIPFYSMCEHHLLPFFGKVHIGYYPDGRITGLSKLPRVVNAFSRRLQVQERLTKEICLSINKALDPIGVIVIIEAQHMCMQMRGVEKDSSNTVTMDYSGCFEDKMIRSEFISLLK